MDLGLVLLFALCTIGMTHIIIDGSILAGFREWWKKWTEKFSWTKKLSGLVDCYLCCGTWVGFMMGLIWISYNPFKVLACGFAGGFLANMAAVLLNYYESQTMVALDEQDQKQEAK